MKNPGRIRPAHCSLYLLHSQKRKTHCSIFPFHCNTRYHFSSHPRAFPHLSFLPRTLFPLPASLLCNTDDAALSSQFPLDSIFSNMNSMNETFPLFFLGLSLICEMTCFSLPRGCQKRMFCSLLKLPSQHTIPGTEWVPRHILKEKKRERKRDGKRKDEKKEPDKYFRSDKFGSDQTRWGTREPRWVKAVCSVA